MKRLNSRVQSGSLGRANSMVSEAKARAAIRKAPEAPGVSAPRTTPATGSTSSRARTQANARRAVAAPRVGAVAKPATQAKPAVKPVSAMDKVRADKGLMDTIRSDAAALRKPAQKAAPKAAASKKSSGLSANKSYTDYKKLMESM